MPDAEVSKKRFYGIDLLKALSMLMIVTLHVLGNGGVLGMLEPLTVRYEAAYFLEAMCFCAVNCFGLATGYIMCKTRFSSHRLGALWLEVVWHTFGLTLLFYLFMPGSAGPWQFFTSFFPVTFSYYWYFTAYFGMFFFIPFFNRLIDTLGKRTLRRLVFCFVFLFTIMPTSARSDIFRTGDGYTVAWLTALYFIGAYLRLYKPAVKLKTFTYFLLYVMMVLLTWMSKLGFQILRPGSEGMIFFKYTSPTILLAAVFLLMAFEGLEHRWVKKAAEFFGPTAFGVYIIHCHPLVWFNLLQNRFVFLAHLPFAPMVFGILASAGVVFFVCSMADRVRFEIFKKLGIARRCKAVFELLGRFGTNLENAMDNWI